ncbi:MAG: DUF6084 family protein [Vulcanimicrobiaceae bacterium]
MSALTFEIAGSQARAHAASPTLTFRLRIRECTGARIDAIALRVQIQIEPRRRHYTAAEERQLVELFGEPERWGETLHSTLWTHATLMVPGFESEIEIDLPVQCTYDFEVASSKYFNALEQGEIPLLFLFSGTIFARTDRGFSAEMVPWELEASYRLPVRVWRDVMDLYFPNSTWIRIRKETFDELYEFKARNAIPTWDDALDMLLESARDKR